MYDDDARDDPDSGNPRRDGGAYDGCDGDGALPHPPLLAAPQPVLQEPQSARSANGRGHLHDSRGDQDHRPPHDQSLTSTVSATPILPDRAEVPGWRPSLPPRTAAPRPTGTHRLESHLPPMDSDHRTPQSGSETEQDDADDGPYDRSATETRGHHASLDHPAHLAEQRRLLQMAVTEAAGTRSGLIQHALARLRLPSSALRPGSHASCELLHRFTKEYGRVSEGRARDDFVHLLFLSDHLRSRHTGDITAETIAWDGTERMAYWVRCCLSLVHSTMTSGRSWTAGEANSLRWPPTGNAGQCGQFSSASTLADAIYGAVADRPFPGPRPDTSDVVRADTELDRALAASGVSDVDQEMLRIEEDGHDLTLSGESDAPGLATPRTAAQLRYLEQMLSFATAGHRPDQRGQWRGTTALPGIADDGPRDTAFNWRHGSQIIADRTWMHWSVQNRDGNSNRGGFSPHPYQILAFRMATLWKNAVGMIEGGFSPASRPTMERSQRGQADTELNAMVEAAKYCNIGLRNPRNQAVHNGSRRTDLGPIECPTGFSFSDQELADDRECMIHRIVDEQARGAMTFPGKDDLREWANHHRLERGTVSQVGDPSWRNGAGPFQLAVLAPDLPGGALQWGPGITGVPYILDNGNVGEWPWDDTTLKLDLPGFFEPTPRCPECGTWTLSEPSPGVCPACLRLRNPMSQASTWDDQGIDRIGNAPPPSHPTDLLGDAVIMPLVQAASRFAPKPCQIYDIPGSSDITSTWLLTNLLGAWKHMADRPDPLYPGMVPASPAGMRRAAHLLILAHSALRV